jgi:hypothetical protein
MAKVVGRGAPPLGARLCDAALFGRYRDSTARGARAAAGAVPPRRGAGLDPKLYNVLALSFGFFFVFGGFGPTQQFATTLLNFACLPLGSISMGLLYLTLSTTSIVAPLVVRRWGLRTTIFVSSLTYGAYVASFIWVFSPAVLLGSVTIGVFGAFMNCAAGTLLASCCDDSNRGLYTGLNSAIVGVGGILSSMLATPVLAGYHPPAHPQCGEWADLVLIGWQGRASVYFAILAVACAVGTGTMLTLRSMSNESLSTETPGASYGTTLRLLRSPRVRDLLLWICYTVAVGGKVISCRSFFFF